MIPPVSAEVSKTEAVFLYILSKYPSIFCLVLNFCEVSKICPVETSIVVSENLCIARIFPVSQTVDAEFANTKSPINIAISVP